MLTLSSVGILIMIYVFDFMTGLEPSMLILYTVWLIIVGSLGVFLFTQVYKAKKQWEKEDTEM